VRTHLQQLSHVEHVLLLRAIIRDNIQTLFITIGVGEGVSVIMKQVNSKVGACQFVCLQKVNDNKDSTK